MNDKRKNEGIYMDAHKLNEQWDDIRDDIQMTWDEVTDDELDLVDGSMEKLYGLMREKYGKSRDEFDEYLDGLGG